MMSYRATLTAPGGTQFRRYQSSDRTEVLRIAFESGFLGSSMSAILDRSRLFVRSIDWFLAEHAQHCFVAERDGEIAGYALASRDDVRVAQASMFVLHGVADLMQLPLMSPKERSYIVSRTVSAARDLVGEGRHFRTPRGARLHMNLAPQARGGGIGSALLQVLLADLREADVSVVHANTYQGQRNDTRRFWEKNSFSEFSRVRSRAWESWCPGEQIFLICYARSLG